MPNAEVMPLHRRTRPCVSWLLGIEIGRGLAKVILQNCADVIDESRHHTRFSTVGRLDHERYDRTLFRDRNISATVREFITSLTDPSFNDGSILR